MRVGACKGHESKWLLGQCSGKGVRTEGADSGGAGWGGGAEGGEAARITGQLGPTWREGSERLRLHKR